MINEKKTVIVLPAYNASLTLEKTYAEIPFDIVDEVILVDDASRDDTVKIAEKLNIHHIITHALNKGYGANQKTCYDKALSLNADIVIMLHPDYQYTPKLITAMASIIANGVYDTVFGSRILGGGALAGKMPYYKYVANRALTFAQNALLGQKLSEYHTGYRAFSAQTLRAINYSANSNDFLFDNEIICQIFMMGGTIAEITCPTKYFKEASSINFWRSCKYGLGIICVTAKYILHKYKIRSFAIFKRQVSSETREAAPLVKQTPQD